jgi:hypothetical protein
MAAELKGEHRVVYLYGITASQPAVPELTGVDRVSPVESVAGGGVFSWISRVPALEFQENLARNMEDLDWLAEASVAHQRVISAIAAGTEMLPARLGTIFRNDASLLKHISRRASEFKQDFDRIRGADEWGVKVFEVDPVIVAPRAKVRSGRDYLQAKAALLPARKQKKASDGELSRFAQALDSIAEETAPPGAVSRGQRGVAFRTTLLVKRENKKKLDSVLRKFARQWSGQRRIECTGPWPPYSFVSRPDDGVRTR